MDWGETRRRGAWLIVGMVMVVASGLGGARPVWADPHAIFYTAIGQQQLFFNVLAALDQADYVETAVARKEILDKRSGVEADPKFEPEDFPLVRDTDIESEEPGVSTILTRSVALEGADLYTDQLVRLFSAEHARRNSLTELIVTLCDYALGFEDCVFDLRGKTLDEKVKIDLRRGRAVMKSPLVWANAPYTNGAAAALNSGNPRANVRAPNGDTMTDEEYRELLMTEPEYWDGLPVAFSESIAKWRRQIDELDNAAAHHAYLDKLISQYLSTFQEESTLDYPLLTADFDERGNPIPKPFTRTQLIENAVLRLPEMISNIADDAAERVRLQQQFIEDEGLLADTQLQANPPPIREDLGNIHLSDYGELSLLVDNPVGVREGQVYGLTNALTALDASQRAAALEGLDVQGSKELVYRPEGGDGDGDGDGQGEDNQAGFLPGGNGAVAGVTEREGRVLAGGNTIPESLLTLFDKEKYPIFDADKKPTSPSANLVQPHLEQGAVHAMRIMTAGKFRPDDRGTTCGWTCGPGDGGNPSESPQPSASPAP